MSQITAIIFLVSFLNPPAFFDKHTVDCDLDDGRMGIKQFMQRQPVAHECTLELRGHKGRKARMAKMLLRFSPVTIHKNEKCL